MNKSIAALAGCVLVGAAAFQALAQTGKAPITQTSGTAPATAAAAVPPVRVAIVNINKVLKGFNKAQQLNTIISQDVNAFGQRINAKRDAIVKLEADIQKTVDPVQRENIQKQAKLIEREMQDLDAEARKEITTKQGSIAIQIYRDIESVVQRCAAANGFDIVLSYPDATTNEEMYSQPNVVRKLASQAAIPLYYKPHVDLTESVVVTLNATHPVAQPAATSPTPPATGLPPTTPPTAPGTTARPRP